MKIEKYNLNYRFSVVIIFISKKEKEKVGNK